MDTKWKEKWLERLKELNELKADPLWNEDTKVLFWKRNANEYDAIQSHIDKIEKTYRKGYMEGLRIALAEKDANLTNNNQFK